MGKAIEKTPVGDHTKIDETLIGAGEAVDDFRDDIQSKQLDLLIANKDTVVAPFVDSINRISYLYNQPFELLMDSENLYLKPMDENTKD